MNIINKVSKSFLAIEEQTGFNSLLKLIIKFLIELLKKSKEQLNNRVYTGLLYSIVELFNNKEFNMNRLLPIDFSDLRELMKNFNTTNVFKQLSRAEKREYIKSCFK